MSRSSKATLLDGSGLEKSLKIVKNEAEEQLENFLAPVVELADDISSGRSKIVKPSPGFCIKAFRRDTEKKFFINVCQTDEIPPPRDITEDELIRLLNDGEPNSFRVPLSISQPRDTLDKASQGCQVCDIALNSKFFRRIEEDGTMREFVFGVLIEGIADKYGVQLDERSLRVLKNKRFIDRLIPHNIQNRDVRRVIESYPSRSAEDTALLERLDNPEPAPLRPATTTEPAKKALIEEIDAGTVKLAKNETNSTRSASVTEASSLPAVTYVPDPTKVAISQAACRKPESKLFREPPAGRPKRLIGEFHLPDCNSSSEITLDVGEDRILLEARKKGYMLDVFVEYRIDENQVEAHFDTSTKILQVTMPVLGA